MENETTNDTSTANSENFKQNDFKPDNFINLLNSIREIGKYSIEQTSALIKKYQVQKYFSKLIRFLAQRPILTFALVATIGVCIVPIALFVLFAVGTLMLTFTGFIVIEGTMLTMGTVMLCSCLLSIWLVLLTVGGTAIIAYVGFMRMYGLLHSSENVVWWNSTSNINSQSRNMITLKQDSRLNDITYKVD